MSTNGPTTKQAQIEALWARDVGVEEIIRLTSFTRDYVQNCVRMIQAHARSVRPQVAVNDDTKHLRAILAKHGCGFPFYARVPL